MAEKTAQGEAVEYLFWVGCAGSFDARAQKVSVALAEILTKANISFAILGTEESCTGDPARRAGNEFLFQMLAQTNIQTLNGYGVKKIITSCPHCFNTLKNEYPVLGGDYEVMHHSQLIHSLLAEGKIKIDSEAYKGKKIVYHDSCYLGRVNGIYELPREILSQLDAQLLEMKRSKSKGLCCGAGGAQMFKEDEPGKERINMERGAEAMATGADIVALNCPFCMTMMTDGVKENENMMVLDLAELVINSQ